MNQRLADALEICWQDLEIKADVETCLSMYPDLEEDLRPVLDAHIFAQMISVPGPSPSAINKSRTKMFARVNGLRQQSLGSTSTAIPRVASAILVVALVFIFGSGGILAVSAATIPGDALYPLKLRIEEISIELVPGQSLKTSLQMTYSKRRFGEAQKLLTLKREEKIKFEGVITAIEQEGLLINDLLILITNDTVIFGLFEEGEGVEIIAVVQDGLQLVALQVRLRSFRHFDNVISIADDHWIVGELRIRVDALTVIEHGVQVGDRVLVRVRLDDEGLAYAQAILRDTIEGP